MTVRVVVVGGGPAGLATATTLARLDVAVTLLEAGAWPRTTMCGEFLSPDAERAIEEIGAGDRVRRFRAPTIEALRVTVSRSGRVVAEAASQLDVPGRGLSRLDLDAALAESARVAGVTILERTRVESIACDAEGVSAGTTKGDAVVVATGRVPGVGRGRARPSRDWVAVKMHVAGVRMPSVTELHFVDGAYVGLNEVACGGGRDVNVCALARSDAWERAGAAPDGLWDLLRRESPAFDARMRRAAPIDGSAVSAAGFGFSVRGPRGVGDRPPLYVGDSAALITPLCGDGQAMALGGGVALGRILAERAQNLDPSGVRAVAAAWDREFRRSFRGRLALGRALQAVMLRPRAASALVRAAASVRPMANWLYRETRGRVEPSRS